MSARSSRTFVLALVTFAAFTDIVAYSVAVPVLPDLTSELGRPRRPLDCCSRRLV